MELVVIPVWSSHSTAVIDPSIYYHLNRIIQKVRVTSLHTF
jgi:hypothetical protein